MDKKVIEVEHKHQWESSFKLLGLVGSLYRYIWPLACRCGALAKTSYWGEIGEVLEPKKRGEEAPDDQRGNPGNN